MYYAACERLANERPELRQAVEQVDELLAQNANALVTIDLLRTHAEASGPVLETLFEELTSPEAFGCEQVRYCPEHDQVFALDETCDLCEDDSSSPLERNAIRPPQPMSRESGNSGKGDEVPVRVLISYSHDSPKHAKRVLDLSDQLRAHGIDCRIDQYTPVPEEGWPLWMERQIEASDFVICICSAEYARRFVNEVEPDVGRGVAWEANLIRNELYQAKSQGGAKFLTLQFDQYQSELIPKPLQGCTSFTLSNFALTGDGYGDLYRHLTGQPETPITPLGKIVEMPQVERLERRSSGAPKRVEIREVLASTKSSPVTDPKVLATESRNPQEEREALCVAWKNKKVEFEWRLVNAQHSSEMDEIERVIELAKQKILDFCV